MKTTTTATKATKATVKKATVKKTTAKKTMVEKNLTLIEKINKEIAYIKYNPKKKLDILKNGMNKKMESFYFFIPNINSIKAFNDYVNLQGSEGINEDIELLKEFTSTNTICNEDRCSLCKQYCYCEKAKFYKNNMSSRFNILLAYLKDSQRFFDRINKEIAFNDIDLIRLHTEGDFFSREYILQWFDVMKNNPNVKFYSYTKQFEFFEGLELPSNFTLQLSFDVNSTYDIPKNLLAMENVNIYLTYDNIDNVDNFTSKNGIQKMDKKECLGKCKRCRNCYTNTNTIHLCKIH